MIHFCLCTFAAGHVVICAPGLHTGVLLGLVRQHHPLCPGVRGLCSHGHRRHHVPDRPSPYSLDLLVHVWRSQEGRLLGMFACGPLVMAPDVIMFCIIGRSCHKYNFLRQKMCFVATKVCLSQQNFCHDRHFRCNKKIVATNICRDIHNFVVTSLLLSRQNTSFVMTKVCLS